MEKIKVGHVEEGTVVRVYPRYAILLFKDGWTGLLHISEISYKFIRNFTSYVKVGSIYTVKVIDVNEEGNNIKLSLKQMGFEDRRKAREHVRINKEEIDPTALLEKMPAWIEEINKGGLA